MIHRQIKIVFTAVFVMILSFTGFASSSRADFSAPYLYNLANFSGTVPSMWAKIFVDEIHNEIYVIDPRERDVKIFNSWGMEIYRFGQEKEVGTILDGALEDDGHILLLSRKMSLGKARHLITRCNFRGDSESEIAIRDLPAEFSMFSPDRIIFKKNRVYLADRYAMKVIVTDETGHFQAGYDILSLLKESGMDDPKDVDTGMFGFWVDKEGNLLCTVPGLFSVLRVSPDRKITGFGIRGSGPGKFGVVSGIVTDDRGFHYVSDRLRCVVLVFDNELKFQGEFGYRGFGKGNLIAPNDLAIDGKGFLYVAQAANRGVSVFRVSGLSDRIEQQSTETKTNTKGGEVKNRGMDEIGNEVTPVKTGGMHHPPKKVNPS